MKSEQKRFGLIGFPLGHSLSPVMHNTAFEGMGIEASYELFPLEQEKLDDFFIDLKKRSSSIAGLNVTIPHKENVIKYLDTLSPFAQKVMAVNTIAITAERKLGGDNTDGPGFLTHLTELGVVTGNKRIAVIGAGGAARGIISVLCLVPERPESIRIYDIDGIRAQNLIADLGGRMDVGPVMICEGIEELNIEVSDILINATPVGMKSSDPLLVDPKLIHPGLFVYDLIYNPARTKLLEVAESRGAQTSNGLGMLFYQGILAFQHWTNLELEYTIKNKVWEKLNEALYQN